MGAHHTIRRAVGGVAAVFMLRLCSVALAAAEPNHETAATPRSFYVMDLKLQDTAMAVALSARGLAVISTSDIQRVICDASLLPVLDSVDASYAIVLPQDLPDALFPEIQTGLPDSSGHSAFSPVCISQDGWQGYCVAGTCDELSPEYYDGVDIGCGTLTTSGSVWQFDLPFYCAATYTYLSACYYGHGSGIGDNGPDIVLLNWQTGAYDVIAENVGTSQTWHCGYTGDLTIGKYFQSTTHQVVVGIFAHGLDCAYVSDVRLCYDYIPQNATLHCGSTPSGAALTVDEVREGYTPRHVSVAPGAHVVRMDVPCYRSCTLLVNADCGQSYNVNCLLTELPTTVELTSDPPGTLVYDGAVEIGVTPCTQVHVQPGPHWYVFRRSGYYECEKRIDVLCGMTQSAFCTLTPCTCDCHADPLCDGIRNNVQDVVLTVNVAFRGAAAMPDPNNACPYEVTDTNCSGTTDVVDVVKIVNVAFRGGNPATEFCDPCP